MTRFPPLPQLRRSHSFGQECEKLIRLVSSGKAAYADRSEMMGNESIRDRLLSLGLNLGASCLGACALLIHDHPYWSCVCVRNYLEFSLRLLWAAREPVGYERMYSYDVAHDERWAADLQRDGLMDESLIALRKQLPRITLPAPMPGDLKSVLRDIGERDVQDGVESMYREGNEHYLQMVKLLHQYAHASPFYMNHADPHNAKHAAHAASDASSALLRALGYRLEWEQNAVIVSVARTATLSGISSEEYEKLAARLPPAEED